MNVFNWEVSLVFIWIQESDREFEITKIKRDEDINTYDGNKKIPCTNMNKHGHKLSKKLKFLWKHSSNIIFGMFHYVGVSYQMCADLTKRSVVPNFTWIADLLKRKYRHSAYYTIRISWRLFSTEMVLVSPQLWIKNKGLCKQTFLDQRSEGFSRQTGNILETNV
jgi:hypothetical protein